MNKVKSNIIIGSAQCIPLVRIICAANNIAAKITGNNLTKTTLTPFRFFLQNPQDHPIKNSRKDYYNKK